MATSSKVKFNLEKLREEAIKSIDERISNQRRVVASFDNDDELQARVQEWRVNEEARIRKLVDELNDGAVDNHRLSKFKIADIPKIDRWDRERAEQSLRNLEALRSRITAKSESLVGDEDGNISLTKTQLSEFFGL